MAALKVTDQSGNTEFVWSMWLFRISQSLLFKGIALIWRSIADWVDEIAHLDKTFGKPCLTGPKRKNIVIDPKYLFQVTGVLRDGLPPIIALL